MAIVKPVPPHQHIREVIGANIVSAREAAGLTTQEDLADAIGARREQISAWERGRRQPSFPHLIAIADATGHSDDLGWFYNEHEDDDLTAAASAP